MKEKLKQAIDEARKIFYCKVMDLKPIDIFSKIQEVYEHALDLAMKEIEEKDKTILEIQAMYENEEQFLFQKLKEGAADINFIIEKNYEKYSPYKPFGYTQEEMIHDLEVLINQIEKKEGKE